MKITGPAGGYLRAILSVKRTNTDTATDFGGNYQVEAQPENTLVINYSG
jgi:hypothetical protein